MLGSYLDNVFDAEAAVTFRMTLLSRLDCICRLYSEGAEKEIEICKFEHMLVALKVPQREIDWFINYAHDRN